MSHKITLTPTALNDLQEAIDYYNAQQQGLGRKFENSIHDTFLKISNMPQSASFAYDTVRYKVVNKFPFIITYEALHETIVILRIFNHHQDPDQLSNEY